MAEVGADCLVLLHSPAAAGGNGDTARPDVDLRYLTGIRLPGAALALLPGEERCREVLFAPRRGPRETQWDGPLPSPEAQAAAAGVELGVPAGELDGFLEAVLGGGGWGPAGGPNGRAGSLSGGGARDGGRDGAGAEYAAYRPPAFPAFGRAVAQGRATVWLPLGERPRRGGPPPSPGLRLARRLRRRWPELAFRDVGPLIAARRQVKSDAELALLGRAVEITVEAFEAALRRVPSAGREHQIQATLEFVMRDRGARPGFDSIVAAGDHATVLHYRANDAPIPRDSLLLIDAGAEVEGYTADLTRTVPVSGVFSETQRALYEAVLAGWEAGLERMTPGATLGEVHDACVAALAVRLCELGLASRPDSEQVGLYFPHGVSHWIGLGVHDAGDRSRPLEPGMVLTLEPGLYVRARETLASETVQQLPAGERRAVTAAVQRFAGLGVRIEDDVLITESGPTVLSEGLPRGIEELEALMATAGPPVTAGGRR